MEKWETRLGQLQQQKTELEQQLADPAIYNDEQKDRLKTLLAQQAGIVQDLQHAEEQWLMASETLDAAEQM